MQEKRQPIQAAYIAFNKISKSQETRKPHTGCRTSLESRWNIRPGWISKQPNNSVNFSFFYFIEFISTHMKTHKLGLAEWILSNETTRVLLKYNMQCLATTLVPSSNKILNALHTFNSKCLALCNPQHYTGSNRNAQRQIKSTYLFWRNACQGS